MENFKVSAPEFYDQYFKDRKIYNAPTNYTELMATIRNQATHEPLIGAKLHAEGTDAVYDLLSDLGGVIDKKPIKKGVYKLTFSMPGFKDVVMENVAINVGEKEELQVDMIPV